MRTAAFDSGLSVTDVLLNGDCLFASVAHLVAPWESATSVRNRVANYLQTNAAHMWDDIRDTIYNGYANDLADQALADRTITAGQRLGYVNQIAAQLTHDVALQQRALERTVQGLRSPGHYSSVAGDLAPLLVARAYHVNIRVHEVRPDGVQSHTLPVAGATRTIDLVRSDEIQHWMPARPSLGGPASGSSTASGAGAYGGGTYGIRMAVTDDAMVRGLESSIADAEQARNVPLADRLRERLATYRGDGAREEERSAAAEAALPARDEAARFAEDLALMDHILDDRGVPREDLLPSVEQPPAGARGNSAQEVTPQVTVANEASLARD
jgi:hypothetical protein